MSLERDAIAHLTPAAESGWRWTHGPLGLEWKDGRTIAFREEVVAVLTALAPGGLPPFGAVVMLLAACRDNWAAADNAHAILGGYAGAARAAAGAGSIVSTVVLHRVRLDLRYLLDDLDRIAGLPEELRRDVRAKCVLAETVFEAGDRAASPELARAVLDRLASGADAEPLLGIATHDDTCVRLCADLEALRVGAARVDAEQLRLRRRTGLEQSVEAAEVELPPARRVRALIASLQEDSELGGVARAARQLLAAVHIPRALAAPLELPVGGVSDLSNRGPLDRLLVSELAHDDVTLTTRIALNEALYLRREAPTSHPPRGRAILIDAGIRMWGVPRVFATAVAMALAAAAEDGAALACFRSTDGGVAEVDLATREGLTAHLEALDPAPHPGPTLAAWLTATAKADLGVADLMLVTHDDVLADPAFARALREAAPDREWHVATVARDGAFRLQLISRGGRRTLCAARLRLDELLAPRPAPRANPLPLLDKDADPHLPVILSMAHFPLRLPCPADPRRSVGSAKLGLFGVTHDGRLMDWERSMTGARQLTDRTPGGRFLGLFVDDQAGRVVLVTHSSGGASRPARAHVLVATLSDGRCETHEHACVAPRATAFYAGIVYLLHDEVATAFDPASEAFHVGGAPAGHRCNFGRFYYGPGGFYAAYFDGVGVRFNFVTREHGRVMFDRDGHGPWRLGGDRCFVGPSGQVITATPTRYTRDGFDVKRVSQDGQRVLITDHGHGDSFVNLEDRPPLKWRDPCGLGPALVVGPAMDRSTACEVNLRNRFSTAAVDDKDWNLVLTGEDRLHVDLNAQGELALLHKRGTCSTAASFVRRAAPPGARYRLRAAEWADGSRAFLDSRGMLHLKSSDGALPEITLALADRAVGGWTSDGQTFGWAFFHAAPPTLAAADALDLLRQFTARLRR